MKWQRELPDSEGEWLWLMQWTCGCVHKSGIAWVYKDDRGSESCIKLPSGLYLSWEGSKFWDGQTIKEPNAWAKIELPPVEWAENHDY